MKRSATQLETSLLQLNIFSSVWSYSSVNFTFYWYTFSRCAMLRSCCKSSVLFNNVQAKSGTLTCSISTSPMLYKVPIYRSTRWFSALILIVINNSRRVRAGWLKSLLCH